jgi:sugar/nucleoside kinase (ribokinase family)
MSQTVTVTGESAVDVRFTPDQFICEGSVAEVCFPSRVFRVVADGDIKPGFKPTAVIPAEMWDYAAGLRCGGGCVNSAIAIKRAAKHARVRCLDACRVSALVREHLSNSGIEVRGLDLRETPKNAIFGNGADKSIFKPRHPVPSPFEGRWEYLPWMCEHGSVLGNSVKDEKVLEYPAQLALSGRIRLYQVLTKALAFDFCRQVSLPVLSALFVAQDEVEAITGWVVDESMEGTVETALRFRPLAKNALIFVTRGPDGVVVSEPGPGPAFHVRLAAKVWLDVQRFVANDPAELCGAGDAFAGGACASLEGLGSVVPGLDGHFAPAVRAAVAGCASALRWVGWRRPLCARDFRVKALPVTRKVSSRY